MSNSVAWWHMIVAVDEQGNGIPNKWNLWRGRKKLLHNVPYTECQDYVLLEGAGQDIYRENQEPTQYVRDVRKNYIAQLKMLAKRG